MNIYVSEHRASGGNEKTEELRRLFAGVRETEPVMWECPRQNPFPEDRRIRAVRFRGLPAGGRDTEVFAYLGFPDTASEQTPAPGMVLVHGGGGHAYAEWVRHWVDHGYAAISFDGFGQRYKGPDHTYDADLEFWEPDPAAAPPMDCFCSAGKPFAEQGYTYYVADILLANNALRADARVRKDRIGLTGISWGGFASGTAICYDDRFAFAAPVYGCGFQNICGTRWGECFRGPGVSDVWDAGLLLGEVRTPIHWFNGDGDPFFDANTVTACAAASVNGAATLIPGFTHGQTEGSLLPEIVRFAGEHTGLSEGNIRITALRAEAEGAALSFVLPKDAAEPEVFVYYKTEDLVYEDKTLREPWTRLRADVYGGTARVAIPAQAETFYFSVQARAGDAPRLQTLHASTGVFHRKTWYAANPTEKR